MAILVRDVLDQGKSVRVANYKGYEEMEELLKVLLIVILPCGYFSDLMVIKLNDNTYGASFIINNCTYGLDEEGG
uniref:Uncharacterized protein n=1 Tax=viral metagenome TaxID=1070528 RepID=A0A6M3IYQ0_9ZZZZ